MRYNNFINNTYTEYTDSTNAFESQCNDSLTSVVDFFSVFNTIFSKNDVNPLDIETINTENSCSVALSQLIDFSSEIIRLHENQFSIETVSNNDLQSNDNLILNDIIPSDTDYTYNYYNSDSNIQDVATSLIFASEQEWIFAPSYSSSCTNYYNNEATKQDDEIANIKSLNIDFDDINLSQKKEIYKFDLHEINAIAMNYITHKCTECDFAINNNIKHYNQINDVVCNQIEYKVISHNFQQSQDLEIDLYPQHLGKVKIKCSIKNNNVQFDISTEKITTFNILKEHTSELESMLIKNLDNNRTELNLAMSFNQNDSTQDSNKQHKYLNDSNDFLNNNVKKSNVYFTHNGIISITV